MTEAEFADQGAVTIDVGALEVAEKTAALADHHEEAAAGVVILAVLAKVTGEVVDARGQQGDLNLGRARVAILVAVLADDLGFVFLGQSHVYSLCRGRGIGPVTAAGS